MLFWLFKDIFDSREIIDVSDKDLMLIYNPVDNIKFVALGKIETIESSFIFEILYAEKELDKLTTYNVVIDCDTGKITTLPGIGETKIRDGVDFNILSKVPVLDFLKDLSRSIPDDKEVGKYTKMGFQMNF